jgi:hypothetical protein
MDTNTKGHASNIDFSQLAKKFSLDTPLRIRIAAETSIAVEQDINPAKISDLTSLVFMHQSSRIYMATSLVG